MSIETTGRPAGALVGYARLQPTASTAPSGAAIFGFRQNGILVTETSVPGMTTITSGRTYAEANGSINTAVAFVNPGGLPVTIAFSFTDPTGNDSDRGNLTLNGNAQIAKFLTESPFNMRAGFTGAFTFSASAPVSMIALRTFVNERNEFIATTQSVSSIPDNISAGTLLLAHFADGAGWKTQVILVNTTDTAIAGAVEFFGQGTAALPAAPLTLNVNGQVGTSFNYTVRERTAAKLETSGPLGNAIQTGSVRITPAAGSTAPSASVVLLFSNRGVTVTEASVRAQPPGTAFRSYVEVNSSAASAGAIQSGIAIANNSATAATVNFELTNPDGSSAAFAPAVIVPAFGHISRFVHELFPLFGFPFAGVLRISSSNSLAIASLRMRYNERGDFLMTTIPATNEASASSSADLIFPQIVDGGGYTTQFALFSGIFGQISNGTLRFFGQDGQALDLTVR